MSNLIKNVFWYIIREMCNEKILRGWCAFFLIPDRFKTQEMCDKAVARSPCMLIHVPDHFKTQEMCDKAVEKIRRDCKASLITLRPKTCGKKSSKKCPGCWKLYLISIRRRRCVLWQLRKAHAPCP